MKIKYVGNVARWFDSVNGNTYHAVRVTRCRDKKVISCAWTYGYGSSYAQTALEAMLEHGWLPEAYNRDNVYSFERENKYPIHWTVTDGLKRDMVRLGAGLC